MAISTKNNDNDLRIFYQILIAVTFSLHTDHQYDNVLHLTTYIFIFYWILMVSNTKCNFNNIYIATYFIS